jgi:acyl carrier protein phosphodiesterase
VFANAQLGPRLVRRHCVLKGATRALLRGAGGRFALTARSIACSRWRKRSRILDAAPEIGSRISRRRSKYRGLERAWPRLEDAASCI